MTNPPARASSRRVSPSTTGPQQSPAFADPRHATGSEPFQPDGLSRPKHASTFLQISNATLWKWVAQGRLPRPYRIGRATFFKNRDLLDFIDKLGREAA